VSNNQSGRAKVGWLREGQGGTTAQNGELYSSAYHIAWRQISPLRKREQPDISLRLLLLSGDN